MEVVEEALNGVKLIRPTVFKDERGYFCETFNSQKLHDIIGAVDFVQDNQSLSQKGVLRGLHFQTPPFAQGKLVRVLNGSVQDVVVDLRKGSPTYGKSYSVVLKAEEFLMLWVPPGFAHGFVTLENDTVFFYKVTKYYNKESEGCLIWNDKDLSIDWQIKDVRVSEKDKKGTVFSNFKSLFS